jgi:hypothetical protein
MERVRKSVEGRYGGDASLDALSVAAGISRRHFVYQATIKAARKRIFALIRQMLLVERLRRPDDVEQCASTSVLGSPIEAYLEWLRGRD